MDFSRIKTIFTTALLCLVAAFSYSQGNITLNAGGTNQKNYYSEMDYDDSQSSPIVKVVLGNKTYRFLMDTGAPNLISKALLKEISPANYNLNAENKIAIWDASDKVDSMHVITVSGLYLGGILFDGVPTVIENDPFLLKCFGVDGIIGSNMLRNSIVHFSPKDHKITITDQPEKLNLSKKPSSLMYLTPAQSVPLVQIKMQGKGKGNAEIPMIFDTGDGGFFSIALNHYAFCAEAEIFTVLGKSTGSTGYGAHGIEKDTTTYRLRAPEVSFNGNVFKNVNVYSTPDDDSRVGSKLLNYGEVTLDFINRKFYFDPFQTPVEFGPKLFPVTFGFTNNHVTIDIIWGDTLKDSLNLGDQVLSLDDHDLSKYSLCDLLQASELLNGKDSANLTLKDSKGKIKKVTIVKQ